MKNIRLDKEYTQKEIATAVGITVTCYQSYEYGRRIPDAKVAIKIAKLLNTTVEDLWGGDKLVGSHSSYTNSHTQSV